MLSSLTLEERQHEEIMQLRERVRQLEQVIAPKDIRIPVEWRLTAKEARFFAHLTTREVATKESLMIALYTMGLDDGADPKIIDVFACKLRAKLAPFGIRIETIWGRGYTLVDRQKYAIKET